MHLDARPRTYTRTGTSLLHGRAAAADRRPELRGGSGGGLAKLGAERCEGATSAAWWKLKNDQWELKLR